MRETHCGDEPGPDDEYVEYDRPGGGVEWLCPACDSKERGDD